MNEAILDCNIKVRENQEARQRQRGISAAKPHSCAVQRPRSRISIVLDTVAWGINFAHAEASLNRRYINRTTLPGVG